MRDPFATTAGMREVGTVSLQPLKKGPDTKSSSSSFTCHLSISIPPVLVVVLGKDTTKSRARRMADAKEGRPARDLGKQAGRTGRWDGELRRD